MDRNFLVFRQKTFSLLELALVVSVIGVLIAALLSLGMKERGKAARAIADLNTFGIACVNYYSQNGGWPGQLADLKPGFIPAAAVLTNPWGNVYTVSGGGNQVTVSTLVPAGKISANCAGPLAVIVNGGGTDTVSITKLYQRNSRLLYDKKYLYNQ